MRVIHISVDLSEATTRRLVHAKVQLPVKPDAIARFTTPLWIPESHINNGPVGGIVGLHFHLLGENGVRTNLAWSRDARCPHVYLVHIPAHVNEIHADFDAVVTKSATRRIFLFGWELVLLYPVGDVNGSDHRNVDKIPIRASVTYRMGWRAATALENLGESETEFDDEGKATCHYLPTTVRRLMDSPILTGFHIKQYNLHSSPQHGTEEVLCIAADEHGYTDLPQEFLCKLSNMIVQTQRLFGGGPPPYALPTPHGSVQPQSQQNSERVQKFYFLVALSKYLASIGGMEHLASAQITLHPRTLHGTSGTTHVPTSMIDDLLVIPHEYFHSWNGKRTTPAGHNPPDFSTPLDGRLLWVYEGLTTYYESVLAVRAGIINKEDWIRNLAWHVAQLGNLDGGKQWRSLEDFGMGGSVTKGRIGGWEAWRGDNTSFYLGGGLVWFGVDVLLRRLTGERLSLDHFMAGFFGVKKDGRSSRVGQMGNRKGKWAAVEYTLDDIIESLTGLCGDYDWKEHFQKKVVDVMNEVDLTGIEGAGYRLEWITRSPTDLKSCTKDEKVDIYKETLLTLKRAIWNSLGIAVNTKCGSIDDVRPGGSADIHGLAPRQTIIGVGKNAHGNGNFDIFELAREITKCAEDEEVPVRLTIAHEEDEWVVDIDYHGGLQYPVIMRGDGGGLSDLLDDILRPLEAPIPN